jgi:hypothetical protein
LSKNGQLDSSNVAIDGNGSVDCYGYGYDDVDDQGNYYY